MTKGKLCLIASALIYGAAPMLAVSAYEGGANGITLTFLRTALMLPLLFILMLARGESFRLNKRDFINIILLAVVGGSFSIIALYGAYDYIATGLATTLHFIYPLIIVVASAVIYREKIPKPALAAVMLVTVGIFLFVDLKMTSDIIGVILAILSGIFYSFYVIYLKHSGLDRLDYIKLTFYTMLITSIGTLIFGMLTDSVVFTAMNSSAWYMALVISFLTTLGAVPLFQAGVRLEGAPTAGIISALEPITTVVLGAAFLGEHLDLLHIVGGIMILSGVVLVEKRG